MSHRKAAAPRITTQTGGEETETMARETGTERYMEEEEETEDGRRKRKQEERVKDICWKRIRGWRMEEEAEQEEGRQRRKWSKRAGNTEDETRGEGR